MGFPFMAPFMAPFMVCHKDMKSQVVKPQGLYHDVFLGRCGSGTVLVSVPFCRSSAEIGLE